MSKDYVLEALQTIVKVHNDEVAPLLSEHHGEIARLKDSVDSLYVLSEMIYGLYCRDRFMASDNPEQVIEDIEKDLQTYLATLSVVNFFLKLNKE